jgi:hypothetical protein
MKDRITITATLMVDPVYIGDDELQGYEIVAPEIDGGENEPLIVCWLSPGQRVEAHRFTECWNAMQGIADPAAFVKAFEAACAALAEMRAFVGVMLGRGPDSIIPDAINTPLGVPVQIGAIAKSADNALSLAASIRPQQPTPAPTDGERTSTVTD